MSAHLSSHMMDQQQEPAIGPSSHPPAVEGISPFRMRRSLLAVLDWIQRANNATRDGGISKGYSLIRRSWAPSYPETTAYTIPTLLNAAEILNREDLRSLALSLADYLIDKATPEGGIPHFSTGSQLSPLVFDTGQAIFGWIAAFAAAGRQRHIDAAERAADWLVRIQDPSGPWKTCQHTGVEKTIDARVSWALLVLGRYVPKSSYSSSSARNLEWVLGQQDALGWFRFCAFDDRDDPLTHTLAYTAEGLFEAGLILRDTSLISAARLTADALLARQKDDGSLAGTYAQGWQESSYWSCLPGNCQMASLWFRFFETTGRFEYFEAAEKALSFVARKQKLSAPNRNIRGAIPGSHPIYGHYERLKYPNWAAKFFADALLAAEVAQSDSKRPHYIG